MRLRNTWVGGAVAVALAASVFACGGGSSSSSESAAPAGGAAAPAGGSGQKVDPATTGDLKGGITIDGTAPKNVEIKMNADPVCVKANSTPQSQETYMVGSDGKALENVFVYVKDGLGNYAYDTPTDTATIDQHNCRYHPHVFGVRVGQPITILNSDPTLHNIHALPKANQEFNTGQPIQGMKTLHTFTAKEVMVPFKCDVHGWMNAYVGVLDHPYFTVSDKDGKFEIKNLPPGTYTIEAWHEKLGAMTQSVTIATKDSKEINFVFKASAATPTN
ncbi:MAG TPA: carboxypeptidase regulatory-like domain-containing protein [Vicinamibacterales bacterium]|nr:carboxypeptidase regulatory-like domain-containing protein [Vicinamibacterales bacterium]